MNSVYLASPDLYHWGVLGMKWGVRKDRDSSGLIVKRKKKQEPVEKLSGEKDSTLFDKAKTTYSQKKDANEQERITKYKKQGYTDKQAKVLSDGERRAKKALLITGGVVLTAAVVYGAYRYRDYSKDSLIKAGKLLQTVHTEDAAVRLAPGNPFYATFKRQDNTTYASRVFSHLKGESNITRFFTEDGIKVASHKSSKKTFMDLYYKNPEFKKYVGKSQTFLGNQDYEFSPKELNKQFLKFSKNLVLRTQPGGYVDHDAGHKLFYDALSKKGYGGLVDVNDAFIEGFTRKPTIIFNDTVKHIVSSTKVTEKELGTARLAKGLSYAIPRQIMNKPLDSSFVKASALVGATSTGSYLLNLKVITDYKTKHPGTKLTEQEILRLVTKDS